MAAARSPALAASALLHGGLLLAAVLSFRHLQQAPPPPPPPPMGESVPVSITAAAPVADVRPAVAAPAAAPAQSEAPEPAPAPPAPVESPAPPAPPPPAVPRAAPVPPRPSPRPPEPRPATVEKPRPVHARPAPSLDLAALARRLPSERRAQKDLDLSALAASLPRGAKPQQQASLNLDALAASLPAGGRRAAAAQRGPARAETAAQARPAVGAAQGLSGDVKAALAAKLVRLWSLECETDGADTIVAKVRIHIAPSGALSGEPELVGVSGDASAGVKQAAAGRALSAVRRGAPYTEVPASQRATLNDFVFNFDARQACRNR